MRSLVLFVVFVAFLTAPAQGQTVQAKADTDLLNELRELEKKLGREVFKPLSVPAYIGISKVELKNRDVQLALDLGPLRARGYLHREICDPERNLREIRGLLFGFTSDRVEMMKFGDTVWTRLWLPKSEVDAKRDLICIILKPTDKPAP